MSDNYNPYEGTQSKVANYVPEPAENRSVMEILAHLSQSNPTAYEEAIEKLIAEKGEEWFKNLRYDWSINGRPKQFPPQPMSKWRAWVCLAGRGWGKSTDVNTLIPTVKGWTLMKNIKVGDRVFDEQGTPCTVTFVTDIFTPEKAYRLYFSDGSTVDVCNEHQWNTWDRQDRKAYSRSSYEDANAFPDDWVNWKVKRKTARTWLDETKVEEACALFRQGMSVRQISKKTGLGRHALAKHIKNGGFLVKPTHEFEKNRVKTTQDIVDTLYHEFSDGRLETNHCIPNTKPLNLPEQNLLVDPYVLGVYLGDGCKHNALICQDSKDYDDLVQNITGCGYTCLSQHSNNVTFTVQKLKGQVEELGVLYDKHIPDIYLRASIDQRLSLLQGLMDTDGYINKDGTQCEFNQSNERLAKQVYELIVSLGMSAYMTSRTPILNGEEKKENWRIRFSPNLPVFRLQRKLDRLNFSRTQILKRYCRYIVKAEEIAPVPMRCITVDSPNSMYLCGEQMLPTHNTKTGGNTVDIWVNTHKKGTPPIRIALVGATTSDVNNVMVGGDSGIMSNYPSDKAPEWHTTNRKVYWKYPDGEVKAIAELFSAEEPDRLRGPQFHYAWCDELAAWRYQEAWDMLMFGLRLGDNPQVVVTTTPRPYPILLDLLKLKTTWTTIGSTYENRSNLAPAFFTEIITKYEGSTLGRQELMAEIIEEVPNAMWNYKNLDANRISYDQMENLPEFLSVILAIDPATSTRTSSAETGMCVAAYGEDDHFYILHLDAVKMSPEKWARRAIRLFEQYNCDKMIAEVNNGGDLVDAVIKSVNPLQKVYAVHASRGKTTRAEPIAALYEQNRVHHIGRFVRGEEQMCVIGDTLVSAFNAHQVSTRLFTGKMITVKTLDSSLTLTYNHPVFTQRGWVNAENLTTEDVLYYAGEELQSIRIEDAYRQAQNENSPRTLKVDREVFTINPLQNEGTWSNNKRVGNFRPSSDEALQFKSDGTSISGGYFRWGRNYLLYKSKNWLCKAYDKLLQYKQRCCDVGKKLITLQGCYFSRGKNSFEANTCVAFNSTRSGFFAPVQSSSSLFDNQKETHALTDIVDRGQAETKSKCNIQGLHCEAESNFGSLQDYECSPVTEIRAEEVRDLPVYNLSTSTEWYVANGFITHNCAFNPIENPYGLKDMVDAMVWAMTWLVDTTQGRNTYKPIVGGFRTKIQEFRDTFKF